MEELQLYVPTLTLIISTINFGLFIFFKDYEYKRMEQDLFQSLDSIEKSIDRLELTSSKIIRQNSNLYCETENLEEKVMDELSSLYEDLSQELSYLYEELKEANLLSDSDYNPKHTNDKFENQDYWESNQLEEDDQSFDLDDFYNNLFEEYKEKASQNLSKEELKNYFSNLNNRYKRLRL